MNTVQHVPTPLADRSRNDLSASCITTNGFFTPRIIYSKEVMPGSKIDYQVDSMTRALAMNHPAYADIETHIRAFYVPYRTVYRPFNCLITNSPYGNVAVTDVVQVRFSEIIKLFITGGFLTTVYTGTGAFDLLDNGTKYRFTETGRYFYSVFNALGYKINTEEYNSTMTNDEPVSALPIMCWFKVFYDYFITTTEDTHYKTLGALLESWNDPTYQYLTATDMYNAFLCCQNVMYGLDYFTSAYEEPNGPNSAMFNSNVQFKDPGLLKNGRNVPYASYLPGAGGPYVELGSSHQQVGLTQALDSALHRISDAYKRLNMVGIRPLDRYFAEYGIKLEDEMLNRSHYLGHYNSVFQISDIMSTAGTAQELLGNYAGKAINYNLSGKFKINSGEKEFGHIIIMCTIVPKVKYYQGIPRELRHIKKYDFFSSTYDNLGVQAIRADELLAENPLGASIGSSIYPADYSIGFTGRFNEYKTQCQSIIGGDFLFATRNADLDKWHLWREQPVRTPIDGVFRRAADRMQYDRIFEFNSKVAEPFVSVFNIKADSSLPCSGFFEDYEWSEHTGRTVDIQRGGTFMN